MTEWQPIETAPKDGTRVLAWEYPYYTVVFWDDDEEEPYTPCWKISYGGDIMDPTHWMPLPEPPK